MPLTRPGKVSFAAHVNWTLWWNCEGSHLHRQDNQLLASHWYFLCTGSDRLQVTLSETGFDNSSFCYRKKMHTKVFTLCTTFPGTNLYITFLKTCTMYVTSSRNISQQQHLLRRLSTQLQQRHHMLLPCLKISLRVLHNFQNRNWYHSTLSPFSAKNTLVLYERFSVHRILFCVGNL